MSLHRALTELFRSDVVKTGAIERRPERPKAFSWASYAPKRQEQVDETPRPGEYGHAAAIRALYQGSTRAK